MNIVIVIDSLVGGGAEKVMLTLAQEMVLKDHNVTILSLAQNIEYDIPTTLNVESLFSGRATKVDRFWQIKKNIRVLETWFEQKLRQLGSIDIVLSNLDRSNNLLAQSKIKNIHFVYSF